MLTDLRRLRQRLELDFQSGQQPCFRPVPSEPKYWKRLTTGIGLLSSRLHFAAYLQREMLVERRHRDQFSAVFKVSLLVRPFFETNDFSFLI